MNSNHEDNSNKSPIIEPYVTSSYGHGWRQMWKYFLELLAISIISFIISIPAFSLTYAREMEGYTAFHLAMFGLVYTIFIQWPIEYGVSFVSLKAARGDRLDVANMFDVFKNYLNSILANILVAFIVSIGMIFLIIPGIIFACKLAFVPYLVVDRKMDAIPAIKESWRMTTHHTMTVFLIGFLAIFVAIAGFICFLVGIIIAVIWIRLAFASLYYSVSAMDKQQNLQTV